MNNALFWFLITLFCIAIQGFYSMQEMAAVSFNRIRLGYYVSKKIKRAIWLQYLLARPSRLFGTIMLGVNIALQVGSQSAREFYQALNLDPDFAPLTQIFLVVIFAELAPLFAAIRFSEHVIMLGIPIVYATYWVFAPLVWLISQFTNIVQKLIGQKREALDAFLSRDELQKVLEEHANEFNVVVSNIFSLQNKTALHIMTPISQVPLIRSQATVGELTKKVRDSGQFFIPLYSKIKSNIVAIAFVRDLVRLSDNRSVREYSRSPWFITSSSKLMHILSQFRNNQQTVAIVLDPEGSAVGIVTLEAIFEEIFGEKNSSQT